MQYLAVFVLLVAVIYQTEGGFVPYKNVQTQLNTRDVKGIYWTKGSNEDCHGACGRQGGYCLNGFCGKDGFCCRKGFKECPNLAEDISKNYHSCVIRHKKKTVPGNGKLSDLESKAIMESNGWNFHFTNDDATNTAVRKGCGPKAKWFGWSGGKKVGTLSATLAGSGEATIDFGNCWTEGFVMVYVNDKLMAKANVGTKSKVATFKFTPGSVLKIKDEGGNSVVGLNSITFTSSKGTSEKKDCGLFACGSNPFAWMNDPRLR